MQLLLLFCMMLIISSDAFPKGSPIISTSVKRKNSESPSDVNFPVKFVSPFNSFKPSLSHFASLQHNDFSRQKKNFNRSKRRSRRHNLTRRKFPVPEPQNLSKRRSHPVCCHSCYPLHVWNKRHRPKLNFFKTTFSKKWTGSKKIKNKRCAQNAVKDQNWSRSDEPKYPQIPEVDLKHSCDPTIDDSYFSDTDQSRELPVNDIVPDLAKLEASLEDEDNVLESQESDAAENDDKTTDGNVTVVNDNIKAKIEVALPILSQISEGLGQKANPLTSGSSSSGSTDNKTHIMKHVPKKDPGCSADGTWMSSALGVEMNITTLPNKILKVSIITTKKEGLIDKRWTMQGLTLSKHGGPLILAAVNPPVKRVASFIGQCKVCQGEDLLVGSWTISKCAAACSDLWTLVETKLDVFKRIRTEVVKKKKENWVE